MIDLFLRFRSSKDLVSQRQSVPKDYYAYPNQQRHKIEEESFSANIRTAIALLFSTQIESTFTMSKTANTKKPRLEGKRCSWKNEPDVIVVVGGKEFHEHSHHLRSFSGYFDAAFRSGMKESQLMRFELHGRDPREW